MADVWDMPSELRGRTYQLLVEITYTAGPLPGESRQALEAELAERTRGIVEKWSLSVSADLHSAVTLQASIRAPSPLAAITRVDTDLDDALMTTGLFEQFDVSGKVLQIAPVELASRLL